MKKLLKHLQQLGYQIADDASDAAIEKAGYRAILNGDLTAEEFGELIPTDSQTETRIQRATRKEMAHDIACASRGRVHDDELGIGDDDDASAFGKMMRSRIYGADDGGGRVAPASTMKNVLGMAADAPGGDGVRVKGVYSKFSDKRYKATNRLTGETMYYRGEEVESASELDAVKMACWLKLAARKAGYQASPLTETETAVLHQMAQETWIGIGPKDGGESRIKAPGLKAILTSGSANAYTFMQDHLIPEALDTLIVAQTLLTAELFPFVTMRDLPSGDHVRVPRFKTPTVQWGTLKDSAGLSTFDASVLIDSVTANVEDVAVAMDIGNYLLSDSAVDLAMDLQMVMVNAIAANLDHVIASGATGADQPEGLLNASGTLDIPATSAYGVEDADFLNLVFGIPKVVDNGARLIMTKQNYVRWRALSTGLSGDKRRLYGMDDIKSYKINGVSCSIFEPSNFRGQGGLTDQQVIYANLKAAYRVWRRSGLMIIFDNTGRTNRLDNSALIMASQRLAGAVVDPDAVCKIDDLPAVEE